MPSTTTNNVVAPIPVNRRQHSRRGAGWIKIAIEFAEYAPPFVLDQRAVAGVESDAVALGVVSAAEQAGVDEVVTANAEADQVVHVRRTTVEPGDDVVDLEVGAGTARIGAPEALLDQDRHPLLCGGETLDPSDVEHMPIGAATGPIGGLGQDHRERGVTGQPGQQVAADRAVADQERRRS